MNRWIYDGAAAKCSLSFIYSSIKQKHTTHTVTNTKNRGSKYIFFFTSFLSVSFPVFCLCSICTLHHYYYYIFLCWLLIYDRRRCRRFDGNTRTHSIHTIWRNKKQKQNKNKNQFAEYVDDANCRIMLMLIAAKKICPFLWLFDRPLLTLLTAGDGLNRWGRRTNTAAGIKKTRTNNESISLMNKDLIVD